MANNCATNFRIVADNKEPLMEIADTLNSLRARFPKKDIKESQWGQTWLRNLAIILGYDLNNFHEECRGYVDSAFDVSPFRLMSGQDASEKPFTVTQTGETFSLTFTVVSALRLPNWVLDWLLSFEKKHQNEGLVVSFRSTDEADLFHICRNPKIIGGVYQIKNGDDYAFDLGQEQEFIECISDLTDIPLTSEIEADAQKGNFDKILALVDDWNKWGNIKDEDDEDDEINIDEPCHVYIYKEA